MGEAPPLNELAARKRLVQAKMELHRAEMALYYQQATAPIQAVRSRFLRFTSHPLARAVLVGGVGFLAATGRFRMVRRVAGLVVPMVFPQLRSFVTHRAAGWAMKGVRFVLRRKWGAKG